MNCRACGDHVTDWQRPLLLWELEGYRATAEELLYCRECADELFRGQVRFGCVNLQVGRAAPCPWHKEE